MKLTDDVLWDYDGSIVRIPVCSCFNRERHLVGFLRTFVMDYDPRRF